MSSKAKRQRGKAAAKAPSKKGTKRARDEDKADKFAESVLASVTCPISHSLVVQPVVAELFDLFAELERLQEHLPLGRLCRRVEVLLGRVEAAGQLLDYLETGGTEVPRGRRLRVDLCVNQNFTTRSC